MNSKAFAAVGGNPHSLGFSTSWYQRHKTPREILKHSTEKKQMHSMGEFCPASAFISNKSALKIYKKKNWANHFHRNLFLPRSTIFPHQLFTLPERAASHLTQHPNQTHCIPTPVRCRTQNAAGRVQLAGCYGWQSPPGFWFCADP